MFSRQLAVTAFTFGLFFGVTAVSAGDLLSRGGGAFLYDPDADVTWVNDWNLAWSTNYDDVAPVPAEVGANGAMTWQAANDWAAGLTLAGSSGWRLPSVNFDSGCYNAFPRPANAISACTSGEFSSLWTETLGGDFSDRPGVLDNQDQVTQFDNIQAGSYWTASLNDRDPSGNSAQAFSTFGGYVQDGVDSRRYAVAVHDGDVAAGLPDPGIPAPVLETRRGGLFLYDPVNDKTWLADANQAWNSDYDEVATGPGTVFGNGQMTYDAALAWADQLVIDGVDGWRLPELSRFDSSCYFGSAGSGSALADCTEGDFTELWVEILLNDFGERLMETDQLADARLFDHWQAGSYWTGTLNAGDPGNGSAHLFSVFGGYQQNSLNARGFTIAVRDGDVGEPGVVPVPAGVWLFGTALIGLAGFLRRRKAS